MAIPNGATQTSYIDANGQKQTGYIIDGRTYTDAGGTTPVGAGSIVDAGGTQYIKMPDGSGMLYSDYLAQQNGGQGLGQQAIGTGAQGGQTGASPATQTTYIDANGNQRVGYIIDGRTYTDAAGTTPVGVGSIVNTGGGTYIKTDNGSMLYSDYLAQQKPNPYTTQLASLQSQIGNVDKLLEQALQSNDAAYAARLEQLRNQIQGQITALNDEYQGLNKQLYRDYMMQKRDVPQALAAQGYTGGLRESSLLGLERNYEEALADNERRRIAGINDLESGRINSELELEIQRAAAEREAREQAYDRAAALQQLLLQQQNLQDEDARTLAQQQINAYLEAHGDPAGIPAELLAISGLDQAYINAMAAKPLLSYEQALKEINSGNPSPNALAAYEYYAGQPWQQPTQGNLYSGYSYGYGNTGRGAGGEDDTQPVMDAVNGGRMTSTQLDEGIREYIRAMTGKMTARDAAMEYAWACVQNGRIDENTAAAVVTHVLERPQEMLR